MSIAKEKVNEASADKVRKVVVVSDLSKAKDLGVAQDGTSTGEEEDVDSDPSKLDRSVGTKEMSKPIAPVVVCLGGFERR